MAAHLTFDPRVAKLSRLLETQADIKKVREEVAAVLEQCAAAEAAVNDALLERFTPALEAARMNAGSRAGVYTVRTEGSDHEPMSCEGTLSDGWCWHQDTLTAWVKEGSLSDRALGFFRFNSITVDPLIFEARHITIDERARILSAGWQVPARWALRFYPAPKLRRPF